MNYTHVLNQWQMSTKHMGDMGEVIAIKYLQSKGYSIKTVNFRFSKYGEIDIVCEHKGYTIFVEVKYRSSNRYGNPEEAVTKTKLRKFKKTIEYYCLKHNIDYEYIRFDVIAIQKKSTFNRVTHYKNVEI